MLNFITMQGRLTKDPELRYTQNNTPVATITIAVDDDINRDKTIFVEVVAWRNTAEFLSKYFHKGQMILIMGKLGFNEWMDKDGGKHTKAEITAERVYFCGDKNRETTQPAPQQFQEVTDDDGNLPF